MDRDFWLQIRQALLMMVDAFIAGYTRSNDYPTTEDAFDTSYNGGYSDFFISVINPAGDELTYSTFIGGSGFDWYIELELDESDQVYISSVTNSTDMPTTENAYDDTSNGKFDCHVCCLDTNSSELSYASYLGGSGDDRAGDILVEENYVIVGGFTGSRNFPTTTGAYSTTYAGGD